MREFITRPFGDIVVDLDNPSTYEHLPQTTKQLDNLMFEEIGKALVYMDYFLPDVYRNKDSKYKSAVKQRKRILKMIKDFADNRKNNYDNIQWYKEQVFLFQDETENMC